jgi:hypothetical protein
MQADVIGKALGPLATIASNPYIWGSMSPEQQKALGNAINSFMSNTLGGMGGNNGNMGMPSGGSASVDGNSNGSQISGNPLQPVSNGQPNTQNNSNLNPPHTPLPGNPQSGNYFNTKQAESSAGQMGTSNVSDWSDINKASSQESTDQANLKNLAEDFDVYYHQSPESRKGFWGGHIPSFGNSDVQNADRIAQATAVGMARAVQDGHINIQDFDRFAQTKFSRTMGDEAEKASVAMVEGAGNRGAEHIAFNNAAQLKGLTGAQATTIWSTYIHEKPYFNPKRNEVIKENMNGWKDYLKPEKSDSILSGEYTIKPHKYSEKSKMVDYTTPDGKVWSVPEEKLPEVKKYVANIQKQQGKK